MNLLSLSQLLESLGYTEGEHVSINTQPPGGRFASRILPANQVPDPAPDANTWFGVCPIAPGVTGRGSASDVTRLSAVWADLDVKPGGCPDLDTARAIVDDLSEMLNCRPVAITYSGHGLQPYWAIDTADGQVTDANRGATQRLLRRWGRLVAHVAERRDSEVDSVYDLPRVLRTPGSINLKGEPVAVITVADSGRPITTEELVDALDAYAIPALDGDDTLLEGSVTNPSDWQWAPRTCGYASRTIKAWTTETPSARHPWLTSCYVRLAAMHAAGCLTQDDHHAAKYALADRFRALLAGGDGRAEAPGEIADAHGWGILRVAAFTPERIARELGNHPHLSTAPPDPTDPFGTGLAPVDPPAAPRALTVVDGNTVRSVEALDAPRLAALYGPTEDGTARALADLHHDSLRYCPQHSSWLTWTGSRWEWDTAEQHRELIRQLGRDLPEGEGWSAYKKRALSASGVTGIARLAQTDPRLTVHIDSLDARPYELNTPGGIIDLRTGTLRAADPSALHTRTTTVTPDFEADPGIFEDFLSTTFGDDQAMIAFMARLFGVAAIGTVLEQVLPFAHGIGANGKSTLLDTVQYTLGTGESGYSISAPAEMLMARKYSEHPAELAQLAGARLVVCSELDDGQYFAEARIKMLTGRDAINARFMRGNPFTFHPTHTFILAGNHKPDLAVGGPAFERRIRFLPFDHVVPEEKRDTALGEKLKDRAPAILAWIARGASDYLAAGKLGEPAAVKAATHDYVVDQDTISRFVEDRCHLVSGMRTAVRDVRAAYEDWCRESGDTPVSARRFTQELRDKHGIESAKSGSNRLYEGVGLVTQDDVSQEWYK